MRQTRSGKRFAATLCLMIAVLLMTGACQPVGSRSFVDQSGAPKGGWSNLKSASVNASDEDVCLGANEARVHLIDEAKRRGLSCELEDGNYSSSQVSSYGLTARRKQSSSQPRNIAKNLPSPKSSLPSKRVSQDDKGRRKSNQDRVATKKPPPPSKGAAEKENESLRKEIDRLKKRNQSKPKQIAKRPSPKKSPPPSSSATGSGFFVSKLGHIITNEHVVRECGSVTVGDNANKQITASVLETDKRNDLALLRISSTQMASMETKSLISKLGLKLVPLASGGLMRSDDIELGEKVLVAGYPYGDIFSNTIKVTGGMVSAVKGMGDDSGQFQMDAAVQPGSSGGPIYDENGNIVGVVVAQLNKLKVAKAIGSMPENVNFGIKASTVRQFMTSAGLPTKWSIRTERQSTKELAKIAKNQTVMVVCNP